MRRKLKFAVVLVLFLTSLAKATDIPPFVIPHTVPMTYTVWGCPDGYEGHYITVSAGFDNQGSEWGSSVFDNYPICISKAFMTEIAKADYKRKH